ncbi:MAG: FecR domain-containing protein [Balneolaceae bacterium]|nr:FecR domain-containing protein [Balneolaceae bacterium]MBO6545263.1 FecR domain-containing protein [Balneolaceae bacterium]MBO6646659.1 FecR domain-containing protein [Balneolaceae bacterium]
MLASDLYIPVEQERPLAIVRRFKPQVELASGEKEFILNLTDNLGEQLFSGDTLSTNEDGYALVVFMDNTIAKVKPESMLIVEGESLADSKISTRKINLETGEIFMEVEPVGSGTFEVATSRSLASVKGTRFGTKAFGYVWVEEGQVDVTATNSGQTVSLFERMFAEVDENGNSIQSGTLTNEELNNLGLGYDELDEDLIERTIILRFRDANGQIREIPVNIFEKGN